MPEQYGCMDLYRAIKNDSILTKQVTESRDVAHADEERDEVYFSDETTLDVSGVGKYVTHIGDIVYGVSVEVREKADKEAMATRLLEVTHETLDVDAPLIWMNPVRYVMYVECESILQRVIEAEVDLLPSRSPEDLYELRYDDYAERGDSIVLKNQR